MIRVLLIDLECDGAGLRLQAIVLVSRPHETEKALKYSADCISMHAMREHGIVDTLIHDDHFRQEGFTVLL